MNIVIFTGGLYPEPQLLKSFINSISLDYIISADSGCDAAIEYNKIFPDKISKIDQICGDFDSISSMEILSNDIFTNSKKEIFPSDKDYSDTEIAIQLAYKYAKTLNEEPIIILIGGSGQRVDHLIANFDLFSEKQHPNIWFTEMQSLYYLPKNSTVKIKNVAKGNPISILHTSDSRTAGFIVSKGFKWESNVFRKIGVPSLSNRIEDNFEMIELEVKDADFILCCNFSSSVCIQ
ncbi:MAG: thiamine diphosphokinase [Treponema sp.]|jgi:thiamine pyrophosphokinase|nr:thiamine diphosphokinase [Treponema sp.]